MAYEQCLYAYFHSIADTIKDCTDRLPHTLNVRNFDILCSIFSATSYLADIGSDAIAAYIHYCEHRVGFDLSYSGEKEMNEANDIFGYTCLPSLFVGKILL